MRPGSFNNRISRGKRDLSLFVMSCRLNRNNFICTRAFLTLTNLEFNGLAIIQCGIPTAGLNF